MPMANFSTDGRITTHLVLSSTSCGMLSGASRISFNTLPAFSTRSVSFPSFSCAQTGKPTARARLRAISILFMIFPRRLSVRPNASWHGIGRAPASYLYRLPASTPNGRTTMGWSSRGLPFGRRTELQCRQNPPVGANSHGPQSVREIHPCFEGRKTRMVPQRVQLRFDAHKHQSVRTIRKRLLQPVHRQFVLPQPQIHDGDVIR